MLSGAPFDDSSLVIDVIMYVSSPPSPYPVKHCRGFMLSLTRKVGYLAVGDCKWVLIWCIVRIDVQFIVSRRSYPLGWYADELEHEGFDTTGLLQSEGLCVKPSHEELIEVAYECRQQQEHGVLRHERLRQPCPSESVIHVIEYAFLAAPGPAKREKSSLTWNIPPKGVIFSDFICTFAMSLMILLVLYCSTKVSEKSDMAKSWAARLCRLLCKNFLLPRKL